MHVFICENTPNGILTGVYDAWELKIQERCSHADIYLVSGQPDNYEPLLRLPHRRTIL